ncbi:MAG: hypothetical protein HY017_03125 [Betaproteobacteria bacterium]|nr:hypothetical protein [Betaproteobacteria bacterium]
MELLLNRPVVVAFAVLGALLASAASLLRRRGVVGEKGARTLERAGYGCMGVSMLLFALAGLRGVPA